jgi:Raf kinase inhibitor-like YbhB/YbcL family protein
MKTFFRTLHFLAVLSGFLHGGVAMALSLTSPSFDEGGMIPKKQTCDGTDLSPALQWSGAPEGTKSFALVMDDPDAPPGTWVHWVIYDVPGDAKGLEEGVPKKETLPNGAKQGSVWGVESFSRVGYFGPCPPPGKPHRYYFKLYALDATLNLPPKATKFDVEKAMKGHILAQTQLMGKYGR